MNSAPSQPRPIDLPRTPERVLACWPPDRPLAALWSGGQGPRARWTVLAAPSRARTWSEPDLSAALDELGTRTQRPSPSDSGPETPPFVGGWIGWVSYDAAAALEPRARSVLPRERAKPPSGWAGAHWVRCDDALVYDHASARWWSIGGGENLVSDSVARDAPNEVARGWSLSALRSATGREAYLAGVRRVLEYIRAGDVYQVNLAHRLRAEFTGSAREFFLSLVRSTRPWFGGYLEHPSTGKDRARNAILSLSPELLLDYDAASGVVVTRPMKGTRPAGADPEELRHAAKDRAELAMIVDLMRNDLGRVCRFGSVRVDESHVVERHGAADDPHGVLQGVAGVSGTLREGVTRAELMRAVLPGGSVTGTPKIRAMQIIDELEPVARGPYCGCLGYLSDHGNAAFNVSIRTAMVRGLPDAGSTALDAIASGTFDYSVGAGIVADSSPEAEWRETLDKAGVLRTVADFADRP